LSCSPRCVSSAYDGALTAAARERAPSHSSDMSIETQKTIALLADAGANGGDAGAPSGAGSTGKPSTVPQDAAAALLPSSPGFWSALGVGECDRAISRDVACVIVRD
jgi:hypothetical protein